MPYKDLSYFSTVFNREKQYRIYLPAGYDSSDKAYPVIYYFHGWGGRHFKDSANLEYGLIGKLVDKYQSILVMWDGNMEESEPRPYNIGYHEHMKYGQQMKDYFLEFTAHIDNTYRTLNDRNSRGIVGFSMGGMMSFYLSGKYPDKIGAAVDMVGSTEFYIGFPNNYTFYPLRYTFTNLTDVQIRLRNSSKGELSDLNKETHNGVLWEGNKNYEYWEFEGGHEIDDPGRTDAFEKAMKFIVDTFDNPVPPSRKWSHYDLYDDFEVWGYKVESLKRRPGFLFLQDVSEYGFGFYTKEWLPHGPSLQNFKTTITTDARYEPDSEYHIRDHNQKYGKLKERTLKSDSDGRLQFELDSDGHEIGIYKKGKGPKLTFIDYSVDEKHKMLWVGKENRLTLKVLNLGETIQKNQKVKVGLSSRDSTITFEPSSLEGLVDKNGNVNIPAVAAICSKIPTKDASPPEVKIKLNLTYGNLTFENEFSVPVFFEVPLFDQLVIDDGLSVMDTILGVGNGDGVISGGEKIMIYTNDHRTQLYYDDPYIVEEKLFDEALPAIWETDGITFSSIIKISEDCPDGHELNILAKYETKAHNPIKRSVHWGRIRLNVVNNKRKKD